MRNPCMPRQADCHSICLLLCEQHQITLFFSGLPTNDLYRFLNLQIGGVFRRYFFIKLLEFSLVKKKIEVDLTPNPNMVTVFWGNIKVFRQFLCIDYFSRWRFIPKTLGGVFLSSVLVRIPLVVRLNQDMWFYFNQR